MNRPDQTHPNYSTVGSLPIVYVVISLAAIVAAFVLAGSALDYLDKSVVFSAIIVMYLTSFYLVHLVSTKKFANTGRTPDRRAADSDVDERLLAIEEASRYFGGSLKPADMFRLVSSRANEVSPFAASVLFVIDELSERMQMVQAYGTNADKLKSVKMSGHAGLAGKCRETGTVQVERGTLSGNGSFPAAALNGFQSSAAIPLMRDGDAFAVLQLYSDSQTAFDDSSLPILEAIGERVTPLILSSLSFERNLSKAMTDPVTDLPNERAFHMILENQIAESQRNPETRPLTILAIDIRGFDELNAKYGYASGDRILELVARTVRGQLRQMDFFARSVNDEFLAILPTANEKLAQGVIDRINTGMFAKGYIVDGNESINPELNFGSATFGTHGETAEVLLSAARTRKEQTKQNGPNKVLWFPAELVN